MYSIQLYIRSSARSPALLSPVCLHSSIYPQMAEIDAKTKITSKEANNTVFKWIKPIINPNITNEQLVEAYKEWTANSDYEKVLQSENKLKVTPKLQHSYLPSYHCAQPTTTNFNDKRTIGAYTRICGIR